MKCQDCIDKENNLFAHAKYVLVDYDSIRLLCQNCFDDYCRMEGELNLDFFDLEMDLEQAFKKISEVMEFRTKQYHQVLEEHAWLKKEIRKLEAIENLMRNQPYVTVTPRGQYSIRPASNVDRLVKEIMERLFPDEEVSP